MNLTAAVTTIIDKLIGAIGLQKQQATQITNLNNKVNGLKIGGRNLVLNSKQTLRTLDASNNETQVIKFNITKDIDFTTIDEIVLSCLIKYNDIAKAGSRWYRIGCEAKIILDNNTTQYPNSFFGWMVHNLHHLMGDTQTHGECLLGEGLSQLSS